MKGRPMIADWSTVETPIGPFTAVVDSDGAVLASGWTGDVTSLTGIVSPTLRPTQLRHRTDLGEVTTAVRRYHDGELDVVDDVLVRQHSGEFLEHAWNVLRTVPAGKPVSYAEFAALAVVPPRFAQPPRRVHATLSPCSCRAIGCFVPAARSGFRRGRT